MLIETQRFLVYEQRYCSGVEAAEAYRHMFHMKHSDKVFILRDQLRSECYWCTTDRVEIELIKQKQQLNKNEVRIL